MHVYRKILIQTIKILASETYVYLLPVYITKIKSETYLEKELFLKYK